MMLRVRRAASSSIALRSSRVRGLQLEVVVLVVPGVAEPDAGQHLEDPVDLLDAGHLAQRGAALVEQGGAQQRHAGVLARLHRDRAGERRAPDDPQVHRSGDAQGDDLGVECLADAGQHVEGQVLVAPLDPVDRALAGAERVGELDLGQRAVLASIPDEVADPAQVVIRHSSDRISYLRYSASPHAW